MSIGIYRRAIIILMAVLNAGQSLADKDRPESLPKCGDRLQSTDGRISWDEVDDALGKFSRRTVNFAQGVAVARPPWMSEARVKILVNKGFPEIRERARQLSKESGELITPGEMLSEYIDWLIYYWTSLYPPGSPLSARIPPLRNFLSKDRVDELLSRDENGQSFRRKDWEQSLRLAGVMFGLAEFVFSLDRAAHRLYPSINPIAPWTAENVATLFRRLDEITVEGVLRYFDPNIDAPKQVAVESIAANTTDEPVAEVSIPAPDQRYVADHPYLVQNDKLGRTYSVYYSPSLIRDLGGRHREILARLLRTIPTGDGIKSGIKLLRGLPSGPLGAPVEVKAIMRGHYRIFGCLDGMNLRLITYDELPDGSVGAYSNRLRELCK